MLSLDIETAPQDDVLTSKFAPEATEFAYPEWTYPEFNPEKVKRLKKDTDEDFESKLHEAEMEHFAKLRQDYDGYWLKLETAKAKHTADFQDKQQKFIDDTTLYPHLSKVLVIGLCHEGTFKALEGDEKVILEVWWAQYRQCVKKQWPMLGHNLLGFDIPFLVRRSWALGVPVPRDCCVRNGRYVNFQPLFIDTAQIWLMGQYPRDTKWSLDCIGHCLGTGGKTVDGVTGGNFWKVYGNDRELALSYLQNDCEQVLKIYERICPITL